MQVALCKVHGLMRPFGGMNNMKKLFTLLITVFLLGFVASSLISVEASTSVNYTVDGIFDTGGTWDGLSGTATRGNTISFDISSKPAGHDFAFWIINGVVRKDLLPGHEYVFTTKNTLQIVFTPTDKFAAVFIDSNGAYLGVKYTTGGAVVDTGLANTPADRPGYVVSSTTKWTSISGSASIADVQENSVFVLTYEADVTPLSDVTVNVTNGTTSIDNPVTFNSLVTVTADAAPAEQVFAGWEENGIVVSYNPSYQFSALYNRTLVATYAASVTPQPVVTMSSSLSAREGYRTYIGQFELLEYDLIEYGFVFHKTLSSGTLTLDTTNVVVAQASNRQNATNEYITSFNPSKYNLIRAYVIYKFEDTLYTIYSENQSQVFTNIETFDNSNIATGSTYTTNSFIGNNSITWNYVHVQNAESNNYAIDGKAPILRRSDSPSSSVYATISGGISSFSFDTRKAYTGDTLRQLTVNIKNSGTNEILYTTTYSNINYGSGASSLIVNFSESNINITGTVIFEIIVTGATGNKQVTVDNIRWNGYSE